MIRFEGKLFLKPGSALLQKCGPFLNARLMEPGGRIWFVISQFVHNIYT